MVKILEGQRFRNPEDVAMDLFSLSTEDNFKKESKKEFLLKTIFIIIFLSVIRIGSSQQIPSIFDMIGIPLIGTLISFLIFNFTDIISISIQKNGIRAIAYCCGLFVALIIVVGAIC